MAPNVSDGVIVTAPVEAPPIPIVPVPLALIVRLVFDAPASMTDNATVPPATAPLMLSPADAEAADVSMLKVGLPFGDTKKALIDANWVPTAPEKLAAAAVMVPVNVGLPLNTATPVPVSSEIMPRSCADVVTANCDSGLVVTPQVAQA